MVSGIGAQVYAPHQNASILRSSLLPDAASKGEAASAGQAEEKSPQPVQAAIISAPRVSAAVQKTLLHLQETGSIFDNKDARLMNGRGVSESDRQRFTEIIQEAAASGAYNDPVAYIQSLPPEDVQVLRRVHSLGETSGVTNTDTVEGAVNLLLPPQNHVDINDDGLVNSGTVTAFHFPPPNAPQSVKDAWEETTKHMSFEEKAMASGAFFTEVFSANVKLDADGKAVGFYDHTDPEFRNIYGTTEQDWNALLKKMIAGVKEAMKRDPSLQDRLDLLTDFVANIGASEDEVA